MLTKRMKKYVMSEDKTSYTKPTQNVYNDRIIKYAQEGLKDLTLLAETLPEKQLEEIFNKKNLGPFFNALFKLKTDNRERILELWRFILWDVATLPYVQRVVGEERWRLRTTMQQRSTILDALYSATIGE
jgi:hypothetical protein